MYGLQPSRIAALKQATRDLLDAVAGRDETPPHAAMRILGVAEGTVARWVGDGYPEALLPLAAALRLESIAQRPIFSTLFASATGHRLVPADADAEAADLMAALCRFVGRHGTAVATLSAALDDGRVVPREAADVMDALAPVEASFTDLRRRLAAIRAGEGA